MDFYTLKALRAFKGISQEQLGKELGVSAMKVCRWEKDIYKVPFGEVKEICDYFGITPNELLIKEEVE